MTLPFYFIIIINFAIPPHFFSMFSKQNKLQWHLLITFFFFHCSYIYIYFFKLNKLFQHSEMEREVEEGGKKTTIQT